MIADYSGMACVAMDRKSNNAILLILDSLLSFILCRYLLENGVLLDLFDNILLASFVFSSLQVRSVVCETLDGLCESPSKDNDDEADY